MRRCGRWRYPERMVRALWNGTVLADSTTTHEVDAWSYEKPGLAMRPVGHWLGFWDEVVVEG